jgi:alpha/beta hydrolase fold
MRLSSLRTILLAIACLTPAALTSGQQLSGPKTVSAADGLTFVVEAGTLQAPESRRRPTARRVTIPYYRLRSASRTPGSPIFLLAGGPGSSWIDQLQNDENAREVAFYRTVADVVLFDQRGAGHALPKMTCPDIAELTGTDKPFDLADVRPAMRGLLVARRHRWQKEGVDLAAYNTVENAADINDLRQALGYRKVTLVGGFWSLSAASCGLAPSRARSPWSAVSPLRDGRCS